MLLRHSAETVRHSAQLCNCAIAHNTGSRISRGWMHTQAGMDKRLSPNFLLSEFTRSQAAARQGRDVIVLPDSPVEYSLRRLCKLVLQPLREAVGPIQVTSGYRPAWLNELIGGSPRSQHGFGLAADIVAAGMSPLQLCRRIHALGLPYDQLIHEFSGWCHVSIAADGLARAEQLTAYHQDGFAKYTEGLHSIESLAA
jgi:hypothetical protein